jgi:hypothetical protein
VLDAHEIRLYTHLGVERLLRKRTRRGRFEYFVKWKGRPDRENSWEKEANISRMRVMEFEAEQGTSWSIVQYMCVVLSYAKSEDRWLETLCLGGITLCPDILQRANH